MLSFFFKHDILWGNVKNHFQTPCSPLPDGSFRLVETVLQGILIHFGLGQKEIHTARQ